MSREIVDEVEFAIACINEFAHKHGMANADALRYLDLHKGLDYVVDGYAQARCQPLELTLEDMHEVCRRNGGLAA